MRSPIYIFAFLPCLLWGVGLHNAIPASASAPIMFKLGWDGNKESNIESYGIYFSEDDPGPPYEYLADVYLDKDKFPDDVIVNRNNPSVKIVEYDNSSNDNTVIMPELKDDAVFYFALKAFDDEGNGSNYSRSLCVEVSGRTVRECISYKSAASALGGGGGGGGGCLISSAGDWFGSSLMSSWISFWSLWGLSSFLSLLISLCFFIRKNQPH